MTLFSDPTLSFKFGLEIGGILVGGFKSISGLEYSRATKEVAEGGINDYVHVLPGGLGHGQITFKRGITYTSFLWEWIHWGMHDTHVMKMPIIIISYDVGGLPARIWPILGAYPVKWKGASMASGGKEASVEELVIAFGGKRSGGGGGGGGGGEGGGPKEAVLNTAAQRAVATKVVGLLQDSLREERERAGIFGGN